MEDFYKIIGFVALSFFACLWMKMDTFLSLLDSPHYG